MESKVAPICKGDNHYSNINNIYIMINGTLMLIIEVWKLYGTTNVFHS